MSVLIKGMEMPEKCYDCPFDILNKCFATSREDCKVESLDRPEWCPLVPGELYIEGETGKEYIGGSDIDPEVLQARYDQQFAAGQRDAYDTIRKMVDLFEGLIKFGREKP